MIYIIYGVAGVGKTTIGKLLSQKFKLPFYDADAFHPAENIEKMENGIPLQDEDREGWLAILAKNIQKWNQDGGAVLACSALKEKYRKTLAGEIPEKINWILLHGDYQVIYGRIKNRKDHYFNPSLLQSQYKSMEIPEYGIRIDVDKPIDKIMEEIFSEFFKSHSEIGLLGLGVMGKSLALNMASKGINVSVFNREVADKEVDIAKNFAEEHQATYEFPWFFELKPFVESLARPRNIFLMVNAGKTVDIVIEALLPFLEKNDLIIDGGNSHYKDTIRREKKLKEKSILFLGAGISGGEEGALKGPSIMPGGSKKSYKRVGDILEKIAAKDALENPCCSHIGPDGSGHFVKMLHNGIEYGEMQLLAEIYHFLRFYGNKNPLEISKIFTEWNLEMKSYLLEISAEILKEKESEAFLIDKILDSAHQKGTGGWSTNAALELGVPFDTITAAVMARNISAKKTERVKASKLYRSQLDEKSDFSGTILNLFKAYKTASMVNHAIGFDLLTAASKEYKWNLNLSEIARIWTNGCIIRSAFMEDLVPLFKQNPEKNILLLPEIVKCIEKNELSLLKVSTNILDAGCPVPVLSAATNYFLSYISEQLSANMIQAQRDFFGAHTYERIDKPRGKFFHTKWSGS